MRAVKANLSTGPTLLKASCETGLALKHCVTKLYVPGFVNALKERKKKSLVKLFLYHLGTIIVSPD